MNSNEYNDGEIRRLEHIVESYKMQTAYIKAIGFIKEILREPYTPSNVKVSMIEKIVEDVR